MSFAALAFQGKKAAAHQRVQGLRDVPLYPANVLSEEDKLEVADKHARGSTINDLKRDYKVSYAKIAAALS